MRRFLVIVCTTVALVAMLEMAPASIADNHCDPEDPFCDGDRCAQRIVGVEASLPGKNSRTAQQTALLVCPFAGIMDQWECLVIVRFTEFPYYQPMPDVGPLGDDKDVMCDRNPDVALGGSQGDLLQLEDRQTVYSWNVMVPNLQTYGILLRVNLYRDMTDSGFPTDWAHDPLSLGGNCDGGVWNGGYAGFPPGDHWFGDVLVNECDADYYEFQWRQWH